MVAARGAPCVPDVPSGAMTPRTRSASGPSPGPSTGRSRVRVYAYIVKSDTGFAPNPFHGVCTLACCKPAIRRTARPGDWVVGLTPKRLGHRLTYVMRVDEAIPIAEYWTRFPRKRPEWTSAIRKLKVGDNCYDTADARYPEALESVHNNGEKTAAERKRAIARDLGGRNALISTVFSYFGAAPVPLPGGAAPISCLFARGGVGHRVIDIGPEEGDLVRCLEELASRRARGRPRDWPPSDEDSVSRPGARCD